MAPIPAIGLFLAMLLCVGGLIFGATCLIRRKQLDRLDLDDMRSRYRSAAEATQCTTDQVMARDLRKAHKHLQRTWAAVMDGRSYEAIQCAHSFRLRMCEVEYRLGLPSYQSRDQFNTWVAGDGHSPRLQCGDVEPVGA